jgi:hypothetical protein
MTARLFLTAGVALTMVAGTALAADPEPIGTFKDWSAFRLSDASGIVCYALTSPEEMLPKNVNHGGVFFLVTKWTTGSVAGEPSVLTGYDFKDDSPVTLEIGGAKWNMFTEARGAWLRSPEEEKSLIAAMKKGSSMRIKGTSMRGTATEYLISLAGVSAAIDKVTTDCK